MRRQGVRARPPVGTAWTPYWKLKMRPMLSTSRSVFDQAGAFKSALIGADLAGRRRTFR